MAILTRIHLDFGKVLLPFRFRPLRIGELETSSIGDNPNRYRLDLAQATRTTHNLFRSKIRTQLTLTRNHLGNLNSRPMRIPIQALTYFFRAQTVHSH